MFPFSTALRLAFIWRSRQRQRAELVELPAHLLFDLGLTRAEVEAEASKPFWARPSLRSAIPRDLNEHSRRDLMLKLNDDAPNFTAQTTEGLIDFHDWMGSNWAMLFSHPKNFTPVCTTELGSLARLKPEFDARGVKLIGLSVDPVADHQRWIADIEEMEGGRVTFPLIGDSDLKVAKLYGMLPAAAGNKSDGRTAADNATVRSVFIIGPDRKIKLMLTYPMSTGRNFAELLRVIDSLQMTARHKLATPADWRPGEDVIILPSVPDEEARRRFPDGWTSPRPYIRIVPQPAG
jgi:alkyl hydroperoxide reductase subunit AhpC/uncharacterized protein YjiS (DUF1127 family)